MSDTAQKGATWQQRADNADRIIDDRAMDRMLDDIERYEPTPLVEGPSDNACVGAMCICVVLLALGVAGAVVAAKAVIGW